MTIRIFALFFCFLIVAASKTSSEEQKTATLPWTGEAKYDFLLDGDSIRIWTPEIKVLFLVSLYGVNCPELKQPYGRQAKKFVESALGKKGLEVTLIKIGNHSTAQGYIKINGKDLGYMLVENGLAEVENRDEKGFSNPEEKKRYLAAQEKARNKKTGMWAQEEKYESPVDFLMRTKPGKHQPGDF